MNRIKRAWKFEIGDLVVDELSRITGIVSSRDVQSVYMMDRPVKIVEEEVYRIVDSTDQVIRYAKGKGLQKLV